MRLVNIIMAYAAAPLAGLLLSLSVLSGNSQALNLPLNNMVAATVSLETDLTLARENVGGIYHSARAQEEIFREQEAVLRELAQKSSDQTQLSDQIYEERILAMLGPPIRVYSSSRVEIKIFKLDELGYRGYIAKIKLFDPSVFRVELAGGTLGQRETTAEAVRRTGAVLGINGGGFYTSFKNGRQVEYPLGNTVIDGEYMGGFNPSDDLFFTGIQKNGNLVGGIFPDKNSFSEIKPWQGVSFLPILIQDGRPLSIPKEWSTTRHPRTIIGEYANGDLIMIVVDGRQSDYSSGVTLERLQYKLAELGVKEGYNLDGGGSTTLVYKGEVLNRPSDGRLRPVVTNIVILP
ncbi:MAG: multidrug transporter [Peptococcaceae bacterium BICA1-7]|nr:MAG: multidrug transporter [Peptococcaceae bacterium BICA1-7]HBV99528.1 phosphodiester glycosidase family protein [Desulfotomaculum sp.]